MKRCFQLFLGYFLFPDTTYGLDTKNSQSVKGIQIQYDLNSCRLSFVQKR